MGATGILIVFTSPVDGTDEEFNRWYTERHAPDILKLGAATGFRRYKATGIPLLPGIPEPARYAVIYDLHAETQEEIEQAVATIQQGMHAGVTDTSTTMDMSSVQAAFLLPITDYVSA